MKQLFSPNLTIHHQLSPVDLTKAVLEKEQGRLADNGALCILTGPFTGRSPRDKFIVQEPGTAGHIDWNSYNQPISREYYELIKTDIIRYLDNKKEIWKRQCLAGADPDYRLLVTVINEEPAGNLFAYNMFLRPEEETAMPMGDNGWTLIQAPGFMADPSVHGTRSGQFVAISFEERMILIGGTGYTGEIKKSIFSVLNLVLPLHRQILTMHCSANTGAEGDTALFFGLSGTGKTTLSTDPGRLLIGDDEHGWSETGIFNLEGGCYAKTIGLDPAKEPDVFAAIRAGALVENVVMKNGSREIDFDDASITENTRVSYPIRHIRQIAVPSIGGEPQHIFFLTCDATGVIPAISRLSTEQAMYHFISGYTSKMAGTEMGVVDPRPTFSACFGAPFLPLPPAYYAQLLGDHIRTKGIRVWLVNTGWSGRPFGEGKRMSLPVTRSLIRAALDGVLDTVAFERFPVFGWEIPLYCPGIPDDLLDPRRQAAMADDYDNRLQVLAEQFVENAEKVKGGADETLLQGGPLLNKYS